MNVCYSDGNSISSFVFFSWFFSFTCSIFMPVLRSLFVAISPIAVFVTSHFLFHFLHGKGKYLHLRKVIFHTFLARFSCSAHSNILLSHAFCALLISLNFLCVFMFDCKLSCSFYVVLLSQSLETVKKLSSLYFIIFMILSKYLMKKIHFATLKTIKFCH